MLLLKLSIITGACSDSKDYSNTNDTTAVAATITLEETESTTEESGDTFGTAESSINDINTSTTNDKSSSEMQVHFIYVGQGDSTLIKSGEHYMLIDAGDNNKGTLVQNYLKEQGFSKLDYLVLTHPDADHIGGADVIVTKIDIDTILMSDFKKKTDAYHKITYLQGFQGFQYGIYDTFMTNKTNSHDIVKLGY